MNRPLVLATDLDGTLAAGPVDARDELLNALRAHPAATLVYVTGRTPDSARALIMRARLPTPAFLIADIGTSVLHGIGPSHVENIERDIDACWPGSAVVRARLSVLEELEAQDIVAPRRVSYWIARNRDLRAGSTGELDFEARTSGDTSLSLAATERAQEVAARAAAALHGLPVDIVVSANVYLDVLPHGVNKGSTLIRVLTELHAGLDTCVVAGDSLNDQALFEIGAAGIVVGNCEPALSKALAGRPRVYLARQSGAAGILEGLQHLRALPEGVAAKRRQHAE